MSKKIFSFLAHIYRLELNSFLVNSSIFDIHIFLVTLDFIVNIYAKIGKVQWNKRVVTKTFGIGFYFDRLFLCLIFFEISFQLQEK